jgi:hypothetical protein
MLDAVNGRQRLVCDNPARHLRGWAYPQGTTPKAAREFARAHGWSTATAPDGSPVDLCPTCSGVAQ